MKIELIKTEDGSSSLAIPEWNEQYHSTHGAVQESMHVFIEAGLKQMKPKTEIKIFEMGLGTGLNCILTYLQTKKLKIFYNSIERYPLSEELFSKLNYAEHLKLSAKDSGIFSEIHSCKWNINAELTPDFILKKEKTDLNSFTTDALFDLVYFDAFSPNVQPELWTERIFKKMYSIMEDEGILTTYCAKGAVRRAILSAGFKVERLPGPPGKREILRAIKASK
ncbi:MAG: tRNA (5-methylaminomethyl-2-thiouridine)(34)-methyltransferase MnmD [Bacteroidales bacterium]|nr:tRNA (5-methylaminomethyl-2-thiouridine)(34)-methyltransferase MnmD [Bacteroidales bacterium]MBN2818146.1 tRNA (5-methylaminomethyl-2-thiouridine)(34)-methyltransferase MnmD [Bacteroidales bacterium]